MKLHDLDDDVIGLVLSAVYDGRGGLAAPTEAAHALALCSKTMRGAVYKWALPLAKRMRTHLGTKFVLHAAGSPEERPLRFACREAHVVRHRATVNLALLTTSHPHPIVFLMTTAPPWANDRMQLWSMNLHFPALTLTVHRSNRYEQDRNLCIRVAIVDRHGYNMHMPGLTETFLSGRPIPRMKKSKSRSSVGLLNTYYKDRSGVEFERVFRTWHPDVERSRMNEKKYLTGEDLAAMDIADADGNITIELYILEYPKDLE